MTVPPRTNIVDVLACLDDEFATFAQGFCSGEYLLWLGSGISREVVPGVPEMLQQMLEFLRTRIDDADPTCRFRAALNEVLDVGSVPEATRTALDLGAPVDTWPAADDIVGRLVNQYADVLNVQVRGEAEDFLVWFGLDVPTTYAAPNLEPGVEHFCVAILMLEGVVRSAPTTNWDGLVERAMAKLVGHASNFLRVVVTAADTREPELQADLVKFHGCAVRAVLDEGEYRGRLIARRAQISGWTTKPENQLMKNHLEQLFATRSAFVVGLSAQDANIHTVLHKASQNLARTWPVSPPAVVFAEEKLHHHHKHVLQVTYGDSYATNADAIGECALLGAFAKPALVALVLFALTDKLCALVGHVSEMSLADGELDRVRADLRTLRDFVARFADYDPRGFLDAVVSVNALVLTVFRTGRAPDYDNVLYQPISIAPVAKAITNPDFPSAALGRLGVVVSLLARGLAEGLWSLELGTPADPGGGVLRVATGHRMGRVFLVSNARSLSQLEVDGVVDTDDDDDAVVIQAEATQVASVRSPRTRYGRTGTVGARSVDCESLCAGVGTADELFEAFRLEAAL